MGAERQPDIERRCLLFLMEFALTILTWTHHGNRRFRKEAEELLRLLREDVSDGKSREKLAVATCSHCHGKGMLYQYGGPGADYDETATVPCPQCRASREALGQTWIETSERSGEWRTPCQE